MAITKAAIPVERTAKAGVLGVRLLASSDAIDLFSGNLNALEIGCPLGGMHADFGALKSRFADALQILNPAVMVIEQTAAACAVLLHDVLGINGNLQLIVGIKISPGLVIHQQDLTFALQDEINDAYHRGQVIGYGKDKGMFDRKDLMSAPAILLMHLKRVC